MTPRLKNWLRGLCWAAFAMVTALVFARTIEVCSRVDDGWNALRRHTAAALPPYVSNEQLGNQPWFQSRIRLLEEADKLEANPHATAEDCMGLAWLLCGAKSRVQPDPHLVGKLVWARGKAGKSGTSSKDLNKRCSTAHNNWLPKRRGWSQTMWIGGGCALVAHPFEDGPLASLTAGELEKARTHDPENGIYDYLLAQKKIESAFNIRQTPDGPASYINDRNLLEVGKAQYDAAAFQELLCGEVSYGCVARALQQLDAPLEWKYCWINFAGFENASEALLRRIENPIGSASLNDLSQAEKDEFEQWFATHISPANQFVMTAPTFWLHNARSIVTVPGWTAVRIRSSMLDLEGRDDSLFKAVPVFGVAALTMVLQFLLLAILGLIGSKLLTRPGRCTAATEFISAVVVFTVAFAATFSTLGWVPTHQPSLQRNPWIVGSLDVALFTCLAGLVFWLSRFAWRQSQLPREARSAFLQRCALALAILASVVFVVALFSVVDYKFREVMHNWVFGFPANILKERKLDYVYLELLGASWEPSPLHAGLEWIARGGIYWTVGITFVGLLLLQRRRETGAATKRQAWANSVRYASKSSLWLVAILALLSLALTSQAIDELSARYDRDLARLTDHAWMGKMADEQAKKLLLNPLGP